MAQGGGVRVSRVEYAEEELNGGGRGFSKGLCVKEGFKIRAYHCCSWPCTESEKGLFNLDAILSLLSIPGVLFLVVLKTVVGIPAGVFHSMFSMVNLDRFQLTPESNGRLLSYVGIITMVTMYSAM